MEVAMTRPAIRYTLSVLAAVALVSAFAGTIHRKRLQQSSQRL
jgi:hypothetical protein